jgi:hypothetical protein
MFLSLESFPRQALLTTVALTFASPVGGSLRAIKHRSAKGNLEQTQTLSGFMLSQIDRRIQVRTGTNQTAADASGAAQKRLCESQQTQMKTKRNSVNAEPT